MSNVDKLFELLLSGKAQELYCAVSQSIQNDQTRNISREITEKAVELIESISEVNAVRNIHPASDYEGCTTFLTRACELGLIDFARALIKKGANLEIEDDNVRYFTPLLISCREGNYELIKLLIESGANPNHASHNNGDALITLITSKSDIMNSVKFIIDSDINLNAQDCYGKTALIYAIEFGYDELAEMLVDRGSDFTIRDKYFGSAIIYLKKYDKPPALYSRLAEMDKTYSIDYELLHYCTEGLLGNDNIIRIEKLIKAGANVNFADGETLFTPLMALSRYKHNIDAVKFLVQKGANLSALDKNGKLAITYAYEDDCYETIKFLLKSGSTDDKSPLFLRAVKADNIQESAAYLLAGSKINYCDNYGKTALHVAVQAGNYDMTAMLLKHGANPNQPDLNGFTPLYFAVSFFSQDHFEFVRHMKIVEILLDYGGDPEFKIQPDWSVANAASNTKVREILAARKSFFYKFKRVLLKTLGL